MSIDLSGYLEVFADEAREHLQALNQALLAFEKSSTDTELVNVMFRSAHTLKGMSATMGFSEVAELTHKMENLLSPIRQGELQATGEIVDLLFRCLDALQEMVEAHIGGEEHAVAIDSLVNDLVAHAGGKPAAPPAPAASATTPPAVQIGYPGPISAALRDTIAAARNNGRTVFHVQVHFADDCELKNVRAFMVLRNIKELAELLDAVPAEAVLTEGEIGKFFDLLTATTDDAEQLAKTAENVLEIERAIVTEFGDALAAAPATGGTELGNFFSFNEYALTVIGHAQDAGFKAVFVHIGLHPECSLKSARAFMVHKQLEALGEIIAIQPEVEEIEKENFERDIYFIVLSQAPREEFLEALGRISEIAEINVDDQPKLPGAPTPQPAVTAAAPTGQPVAAATSKVVALASSAAPADDKPAAEKPVGGARASQTIRVETERLDVLLNLVGELVIGKTRLTQLATEIRRGDLTEAIEQFDLIVFDLQSVVMQTRMVPIETVFNRFPRMVRDLAKQRGKQIELVMTGGETELDRTVIDEIGDPLVHLIRNGLDHGIETPEERVAAGKDPTGTLTLASYNEGSNVFVEIRDDGNGIDPAVIRQASVRKGLLTEEQAAALTDQQAVEMIFAAGLSTAEKVTDISGRGVGMDAVKNKLEMLSGSISVKTQLGAGSTFTIKLPLTLAIVQALLVDIAREIFAIPLAYIEQTLRIWPKQIQKANQQDVIMLRGDILPLVNMRTLLRSPEVERTDESWYVVVVRSGNQRVGLCVDYTVKQTEIVIKSLGAYLQNTKNIAGGTILGDGTVALILDVSHIVS